MPDKAPPPEPPAEADDQDRIDRKRPFKVFASPRDQATIRANAAQAGMSVSAFLRALGLNTPIYAMADSDAVMALLQANADLGRLGGLLKLWLSERPGQGASVKDVRALLHDLEAGQHKLLVTASKVRGKR